LVFLTAAFTMSPTILSRIRLHKIKRRSFLFFFSASALIRLPIPIVTGSIKSKYITVWTRLGREEGVMKKHLFPLSVLNQLVDFAVYLKTNFVKVIPDVFSV
jgi:hypothetical protein